MNFPDSLEFDRARFVKKDCEMPEKCWNVKCNNDYGVRNRRGHCTHKRRVRTREVKREKRCDSRRQQKMERGDGSSDVRWKTVPQTSGCNRKRFVWGRT